MTTQQIAEIRAVDKFLNNELPERHKAEIAAARLKQQTLSQQCDHKYPDGTSAVSCGMFACVCEICCETDL